MCPASSWCGTCLRRRRRGSRLCSAQLSFCNCCHPPAELCFWCCHLYGCTQAVAGPASAICKSQLQMQIKSQTPPGLCGCRVLGGAQRAAVATEQHS